MPKEFPVMLASPMKEIHRINFPAIAQTKMDGMRANIVIKNGETTVFSRNGKPMEFFGHFEGVIIPNTGDYVIDGELTVIGEDGQILDRKTGNGILHKAVVGTISPEEAKQVRMTAWDLIPHVAWELGVYNKSYLQRLVDLRELINSEIIRIVDTTNVESIDHAQEVFQKKLEQGEEGIILKNNDHPWENKRSKHIVKMKEVLESDLKIIGMVEGQGKNSGMMGAINCENKDGSIRVDVGTGFTDEQRIDIWKRKEELVGTIITVKHNGVITRKDKDVKSLFLPVFVELRPDKEESD